MVNNKSLFLLVIKIKYNLLLFLGIFIFALLCYLPVVDNYFLSDDFVLIRKIVQEGIFYTWGENSGGFLRPITIFSYFLDYKLWGLNPIGYHLTNILFHAISAFALYIVSCELIDIVACPHRKLVSLSASFFFIVLPCHSESVTWISGRTDVIAVAFGLISTSIFLFLLRKKSIAYAGWGLLLFVMALLSKEVSIILPLIWSLLYIYCWHVGKKTPSEYSLVTLCIAWVLLIGYFGLRKATLGHFVGGYGTAQHLSFFDIKIFSNIFNYIARTFLLPGLPEFLYMIFLLVITLFMVMIFFLNNSEKANQDNRWSLFTLLVLCYLVALTPTLTMSISLFDTQNERFLYLPSVFSCIFLAVILEKVFQSKFWKRSVFVLIIFGLGFSLQSVNNRWINASILSRGIANEISKMDLENIVIINVPDNYQGAYVFRNGLQEAAMLISGKNSERKAGYLRAIVYHNLDSLFQKVNTDIIGSTVLVTFPNGLYFYEVDQQTFPSIRNNQSLSISVPNEFLNRLEIFSFESGISNPMLQKIYAK